MTRTALRSTRLLCDALATRFPLVAVEGGDTPQSGPCDPLASYRYFGVDQSVSVAISQFMPGQP